MSGGGISALTKVLAAKNDYTLLDFLAHGGERYAELYFKEYGVKLLCNDWYKEGIAEDYDVIVANDIFPDADQRLELFIERALKRCKELRLVITYYNSPRFYTAKRTDDLEILTFLSWDGEITAMKLSKYMNKAIGTSTDELAYICSNKESLYRNGRGVCGIRFKGDI